MSFPLNFRAIPRQSFELSLSDFANLIRGLFKEGDAVNRFEEEFAKFIGTKHAISFSSLRSGFFHTLKSLGFKTGDEIILPSYGFYIMPALIVKAGLKPVFADINPRTYLIEPLEVRKRITKKTKAILIPHLHGFSADMEGMVRLAKKYNLRLIEDCAHACGGKFRHKPLGSFDIGCFSFGPGKNLSTLGGGMITTNDSLLAEKLFSLRLPFKTTLLVNLKILMRTCIMRLLTYPHIFFFTIYPLLLLGQLRGWQKIDAVFDEKIETPSKPPLPTSLSNFQAILGHEQLKGLKEKNQARLKNALFYSQHLDKIAKKNRGLCNIEFRQGIYLHYLVVINNPRLFIKTLSIKGIDIQKDYCSVCGRLNLFRKFKTSCPNAEKIQNKFVYLPNHPSLAKKDLSYIIREIKSYLQHNQAE